MTPTVETMLRQMSPMGANGIAAMTGAKILVDDNSATLVFGRQTGAKKLTHLKVTYNRGADLYDLTAYRYNRKTFQCPVVDELSGAYAEDLRRICEQWTGLYLSL